MSDQVRGVLFNRWHLRVVADHQRVAARFDDPWINLRHRRSLYPLIGAILRPARRQQHIATIAGTDTARIDIVAYLAGRGRDSSAIKAVDAAAWRPRHLRRRQNLIFQVGEPLQRRLAVRHVAVDDGDFGLHTRKADIRLRPSRPPFGDLCGIARSADSPLPDKRPIFGAFEDREYEETGLAVGQCRWQMIGAGSGHGILDCPRLPKIIKSYQRSKAASAFSRVR